MDESKVIMLESENAELRAKNELLEKKVHQLTEIIKVLEKFSNLNLGEWGKPT